MSAFRSLLSLSAVFIPALVCTSLSASAQTTDSPRRPYAVSVTLRHSPGRIVSDDGGRTWRLVRTTAATSSTDAAEHSPDVRSTLSTSYAVPNPAVDRTTIRYTSAGHGQVALSLVDLQGKELIREHYGARGAGDQSLTLDASGLRSGLYSYSISRDRRPIARGTLVIAK